MPNNPNNWIQFLMLALAAVGAGVLDYLYRLHSKKLAWSLMSFLLHIALAVFSGSLAMMMATGLGYSIWVAGAAAGAAGFMNVRLFELIELKFSVARKN